MPSAIGPEPTPLPVLAGNVAGVVGLPIAIVGIFLTNLAKIVQDPWNFLSYSPGGWVVVGGIVVFLFGMHTGDF